MSERLALRVAATFTIDPIEPALRAWAEILGIDLDLVIAPFAQLYQTLLSESGAGVVTGLFVRLEDLAGADLAAAARELGETVRARAEQVPAERVLVVCPASRAIREEPARLEAMTSAERALGRLLAGVPGVKVVPSAEIVLGLEDEPIDDEQREALAAVPYRPLLFAALSSALMRRALGVTRRPCKVLVLDADDTLWSGIVGEDGPEGLELGPGRRALHELALARRRDGVLLALASRNEERDLRAVFAARPDFPLRFEDFSAHRIGWGSKVESLQGLAEELGLGLDAFVFLDDSPIEIGELRERLPELLALQLPRDDAAIARFLGQIWPLDPIATATEADRARAGAYAEERERRGARAHARSLPEFLASLELVIQIDDLGAEDVARASQLTLRTNQLNTTLRRRSEAEIARLASEGLRASVVRARDRFGDYGTVGLFASMNRGDALVVETFLLSCRALGRGIEARMLAELGRRAKEGDLPRVELPFHVGPRNAPARALLERLAGAAIEEHDEGATFSLSAEQASRAELVPVEEPARRAAPASPAPRSGAGDARSALWQRVAEELGDPRAIVAEIASKQRRGQQGAAKDALAGPVEELVAAIFASVLGVDRVGALDGFFELGGHSLAMTEVLSRTHESFFVELPLGAMLVDPTVRGVARAIEEAAGAEAAHALADLVALVNHLSDAEVERRLGEGAVKGEEATSRDVELGPPPGSRSPDVTLRATDSEHRDRRLEATAITDLVAGWAAGIPGPRRRIETLAIPTCDRPEALARCVRSHLEAARPHGPPPSIVVADDSRSPELAARTREILRPFPSVYYADQSAKRAYARALAKHAGVDPALIDFALFDPEGAGHTTGANLNALLLDGAGELVFRADDDTLGGVARAPLQRPGLSLSSGRDPADLWIYPDRASCFEAVRVEEDLDLLALHASLLGRSPRAIALDHPVDLTRASLGERFAGRLVEPSSRVRVSFTGLAGDCGWGAPFGFWGVPLGYLLVEGDSLARLTRDVESYRASCTSREVVRSTTQATISDATFGMTTFVGLDLQGLVPPYLPVRRGQDVLWVQMLDACFDDALFGQIPYVLRHEPAELRRFSPGELFRTATGLDLVRVLVALVRASDLSSVPSGASRLCALGAALASLGSLRAADFDAALRGALLREHDRLSRWAERVLAENRSAPSFWRADVERYVADAGRFLASSSPLVPLDLAQGGRTLAEALDRTRRLVLRFGELCQRWPDLYEAALDLKAQGIRVALPLAPAGARRPEDR